MKIEGALARRFVRHDGIYRSDVSSLLFTPGASPAFRSGRCQGIGHAGKHMPCPSSAMSSGRLFLDRVARLQSPSLLHRHCQDKAIASSGQRTYHRTASCGLTGCLSLGVHRKSRAWQYAKCCDPTRRRYRNCTEPRRRSPTGNRSWSFSTSARGISCESMRNWWRRARRCRMPR